MLSPHYVPLAFGDEACDGLELCSLSTWDGQSEPGNRRSLHGSIS